MLFRHYDACLLPIHGAQKLDRVTSAPERTPGLLGRASSETRYKPAYRLQPARDLCGVEPGHSLVCHHHRRYLDKGEVRVYGAHSHLRRGRPRETAPRVAPGNEEL